MVGVAIDIGGTFTDVIAQSLDEAKSVKVTIWLSFISKAARCSGGMVCPLMNH